AWLLEQGCRVAGVELSEAAITELFRALEVEPAGSRAGDMLHYSAPGINIWIGDVFRLSAPQLGPVDAVYDRAALVALPGDVRADYARHLMALAAVPQLLITYEYDQSLMEGPPFSVSEQEVRRLY